jgi:hypothetical protein
MKKPDKLDYLPKIRRFQNARNKTSENKMKIDVSIGEVVDKVSILEIKLEKLKDPTKRANVEKEYTVLKKCLDEEGITTESEDYKLLKKVNTILWDIEDRIRFKEQQQEFDEEFIQLARSVYFNNDERSVIKRRMNMTYGSDIIEEKEYVDYKKRNADEQ